MRKNSLIAAMAVAVVAVSVLLLGWSGTAAVGIIALLRA